MTQSVERNSLLPSLLLFAGTPFFVLTLLDAAAVTVFALITNHYVIVTVAGLLLWLVLTAAGVCFQRLQFFGPIRCRQKGSNGILLTFDDGPDPGTTPLVLDWLEKRNRKAVFFLVGEKARAHPELVQRIISQGHRTGSHTEHHYWFTNFLTGRRLQRELDAGITSLVTAGAEKVTLFRFPMGLSNPEIAWRVRRMGLEVMGWNRRCLDTRTRNVAIMVRRLKGLHPGDIVLLHDAGPFVPAMLEALDRSAL